MGLGQLSDEGSVASLGHDSLLVHERNETSRRALNKIDAGHVVLKLDVAPGDCLLLVLLLLGPKHVLVELLVKLLVGIVDAELLERVLLKHLEPIDVEYGNK